MTKKHEELVEEIRLLWCQDCADGPQSYETYEPEWDGVCANDAEDLCRERAGKCIAVFLSAFRDGRLDEELEKEGTYRSFLKEAIANLEAHLERLDKFIALSGTSQRDPVGGKEEE